LGKRCFYLNDQDEFLRKLSLNSWVVPFSSFSIKPEDNSVSLKWQEKIIQVKNEWIWGKHNFLNLGVCLVMALELAEKFQLTELAGGHFEKILLKAASEFKFQNLRSEWRDHQGKKYFVDAYNANPSSMKASINSFASFIKLHHHQTQDALFIIGDMRELGDQTQNCHEDLGNYLNELLPQFNNNLNLVYVGEFGSYVRTTFHGDIKVYPNVLECSKDWNKIISDKKLIFLKASRAIKLENLINLS